LAHQDRLRTRVASLNRPMRQGASRLSPTWTSSACSPHLSTHSNTVHVSCYVLHHLDKLDKAESLSTTHPPRFWQQTHNNQPSLPPTKLRFCLYISTHNHVESNHQNKNPHHQRHPQRTVELERTWRPNPSVQVSSSICRPPHPLWRSHNDRRAPRVPQNSGHASRN
jgi:hypothetical protein